MIGDLKYEDISNYASQLQSSSNNIKGIVAKYPEIQNIKNFCNTLDSYIRFLLSTVSLYSDSERALSYIIEKNK